MKLVVVAIHDSALAAYIQPFFVPTVGLAVRHFQDEVKRPDCPMHGHRSDFILFEVASFDSETGMFENLSSPRQLIRGSDIGD